MKSSRTVNWDKVGGAASTLCAVHCVLTGLAMGFISAFGLEFIASTATEIAFFGVALLAGLFAIRTGIKRHGDLRLSLLFFAGMTLLIGRHVMYGHSHVHAGEDIHAVPLLATWMSILGAVLLVSFHVSNSLKSHRDCPCCGK